MLQSALSAVRSPREASVRSVELKLEGTPVRSVECRLVRQRSIVTDVEPSSV